MELSVRYRCPNCQAKGRAGRTKSLRFSPNVLRFAPTAVVPAKTHPISGYRKLPWNYPRFIIWLDYVTRTPVSAAIFLT